MANEIIFNYLISLSPDHVDVDAIFSKKVDEDFDEVKDGISFRSFDRVYGSWIRYCLSQRVRLYLIALTQFIVSDNSYFLVLKNQNSRKKMERLEVRYLIFVLPLAFWLAVV